LTLSQRLIANSAILIICNVNSELGCQSLAVASL
jgi:hypothetical protein